MFERILLAVDGSEHSMQAARIAGDLARGMQSEMLRVVVVLESISSQAGDANWQRAVDARLEHARSVLQKTREIVGSIPGMLQSEFTDGQCAEAISSVAKMRGSTIIVIASQSPEVAAELVLEGMNESALRRASCPVLIVR